MAASIAEDGNYATLVEVAQTTNETLELEWTKAKWRGVWKANPQARNGIQRALSRAYYISDKLGYVHTDANCRGVVVGDIHSPFMDRRAIELACKVIEEYNPDILIYNGDDLDCRSISKFDREPKRDDTIQAEIDIWHTDAVIPLNSAAPRAQKLKFLGNHCHRLTRLIWSNPGLEGLRALEWPALLELDKFGIEFAVRGIRFGDLLEVSHGEYVRKWAGLSAKAEIEHRRFGISTVTNHVHRAGRFDTRCPISGRHVSGWENSCLCSLDPEYMTEPDWRHGLAKFDVRDGDVGVEQVVFTQEYRAFSGGKWFSA